MQDIIAISMCSVVIALVFMLVTSKTHNINIYLKYLAISQSIGLCIGVPCCLLFPLLKPEKAAFQLALLCSCVVGGSILGNYISGPFLETKFSGIHGEVSSRMILTGIILGFIVSFGFIARERFNFIKLTANAEKLKRLSIEKEKINSDLKLLQAQVEPHFLFNTLSNILSLLDHDVPTGKKMLENLTAYLRTSLRQSRKRENLIEQEIRMIRSYLDIFKIRMGKRLSYSIDFPEEMLKLPIPPMMLQPLVENAVKHGIEPKIEGGHIRVSGALKQDRLVIEVSDTGMGIQENAATGVGTGNIKKRLKAMFGDHAFLNFEDLEPSGFKAFMEIPHVPGHGTDRR